jgi:hypothetical protein
MMPYYGSQLHMQERQRLILKAVELQNQRLDKIDRAIISLKQDVQVPQIDANDDYFQYDSVTSAWRRPPAEDTDKERPPVSELSVRDEQIILYYDVTGRQPRDTYDGWRSEYELYGTPFAYEQMLHHTNEHAKTPQLDPPAVKPIGRKSYIHTTPPSVIAITAGLECFIVGNCVTGPAFLRPWLVMALIIIPLIALLFSKKRS